jgi:MOSC domain-containing protein YiiM
VTTILKSIATGLSKDYTINDKNFKSAYKKDNFIHTCEVNHLGIISDVQVDKKYHGGIDKAIHIGSTKHFEIFKKLHDTPLDNLAMGCNICITEYDESDINVGDIYSIGNVKIEVSQPRQACWKIGALFGKEVSRYITKNHATGWYVRVLNDGILDIKNPMILEKRVSDLSIKDLTNYLHTPTKLKQKLVDKILNTPSLAQAYKNDLIS